MQQKKVKQKPKREQIATDFEWLISSPCTVGSQVSLLSVVFFFFIIPSKRRSVSPLCVVQSWHMYLHGSWGVAH